MRRENMADMNVTQKLGTVEKLLRNGITQTIKDRIFIRIHMTILLIGRLAFQDPGRQLTIRMEHQNSRDSESIDVCIR